jgi:hypothetical protein
MTPPARRRGASLENAGDPELCEKGDQAIRQISKTSGHGNEVAERRTGEERIDEQRHMTE